MPQRKEPKPDPNKVVRVEVGELTLTLEQFRVSENGFTSDQLESALFVYEDGRQIRPYRYASEGQSITVEDGVISL